MIKTSVLNFVIVIPIQILGVNLSSDFSGHLEVVKLLASHSANVKCKDKQGYTPLHAAAVSGQLDVIRYLLRVVSEVNILYFIISKTS